MFLWPNFVQNFGYHEQYFYEHNKMMTSLGSDFVFQSHPTVLEDATIFIRTYSHSWGGEKTVSHNSPDQTVSFLHSYSNAILIRFVSSSEKTFIFLTALRSNYKTDQLKRGVCDTDTQEGKWSEEGWNLFPLRTVT